MLSRRALLKVGSIAISLICTFKKCRAQMIQVRHFMERKEVGSSTYSLTTVFSTSISTNVYSTETHLVATIADLLTAGIETVSTTMAWSVLLLSLHPDVQDRMFEEMKSITELRRVATLSDEPSMPYTKAVIAEVLRFSSILPMNVFHSCLEDVEFHGFRIPKDALIIFNLYGAHHDPDVWGDPGNFRPERFLTEDGQFSKALEQATLPFSSGRRICIGETLGRNNLFLMHANIFQKFKVLPNPDKPAPTTESKVGFVLHPKSHEYVFKPRPIQ